LADDVLAGSPWCATEVPAVTATPPASRDGRFCDQIRDSAAGAPRNISEGFGRYRPGDGHDRRYLADDLYTRLLNLASAALRTTTRLMIAKQKDAARARSRAPSTFCVSTQHGAA